MILLSAAEFPNFICRIKSILISELLSFPAGEMKCQHNYFCRLECMTKNFPVETIKNMDTKILKEVNNTKDELFLNNEMVRHVV